MRLLLAILILFNILLIAKVEWLVKDCRLLPWDTTINLGNCRWESLPVIIREDLSKRYESAKFSDKDMRQIIAYFTDLLEDYDGPVSLKVK